MEWWTARRCLTMSTRRSARCSVDHRPRCPYTVALPPIALRLPTMYQYLLLLFGGTSADVGQCRPVEARGAVSTIDVAARARWCRRRVRQGCPRCTSARCGGMTDRAQMSDNVDSSRRAVKCGPSTSPPVYGGTAVACAKVAYDVPVLVVVVWWHERTCRTMSTCRGAWCSVDHRPRCSCTVAPPPIAPRLPTMYQYSLSSGGTSADVGQCRLEARSGLPTIDLAARARWRRRRVRQGCPRCTSARCYCLVGRAQMLVNTDSSRRATQCRLAISPSVCAGSAERLKCMIAHMVALNETIHSLPRVDFRATPIRRRQTCVRCSACLCSKQSHKPLSSATKHALACKTRHQCDQLTLNGRRRTFRRSSMLRDDCRPPIVLSSIICNRMNEGK
jgi:hypothetical protein